MLIPSNPELVNPRESISLYPTMYKTLDASYCVNREGQMPPINLSKYLALNKLAELETRTPLVVFDDLRNVECLKSFLNGDYLIPMFRGIINNAVVVYGPSFSSDGLTYSLYEAQSAQTQVSVLMLEDQGLADLEQNYNKDDQYQLIKLDHPVMIGSGKVELKSAYTYYLKAGALTKDGSPIRVRENISLGTSFDAINEAEAKAYLASLLKVADLSQVSDFEKANRELLKHRVFPQLQGEPVSL